MRGAKVRAAAVSILGTLGLLLPVALSAAEAVPVTILHTNDLHSHFRGERTPLGLGGVARLKTAIERARASVPHSLLVDGGDWSEGNIYYLEGAGAETLKMMDHLGYDVAVVGNHDWLNGADTLLGILEQTNPRFKVVATNLSASHYEREDEFRHWVPPYVIEEVGGVKIAFIGLLTYEFIYDKFFKPVTVTEPFAVTRELARELKKKADAVVVISHNSIKLNRAVLEAAPDVDLLVGAHDHVKLTQPVVVNRIGAKPAWIVEAGSWGRYLGRVDIRVTPREGGARGSVELVRSGLTQMDATVPENPETLQRVEKLEAVIEAKRGPIFHDHVGESEVELSRSGQENLMGNFCTDAYRSATGADFAMDQTNFIYNEIHEGAVRTVDVFNSNPGVYNPLTGKAWTIHLIPMRGKTLAWILNLLYSNKALSQGGSVNFSGVDIVYNPLLAKQGSGIGILTRPFGSLTPSSDQIGEGLILKSVKIQGADLDPDKTYRMAAPGGIVQAAEFLNSILPGSVPLDQMGDTGQEDWRAMADYLASHSPLKLESVAYGRVHTVQPDLGVLYDDVRWEPRGHDASGRILAQIQVRVRNVGTKASPTGARLTLLLNQNGVNGAVDAVYQQAAAPQVLPEIAPGQSRELSWEGVAIPKTLGVYAITAQITGNDIELNHTNDEVTRHFVAARSTRRHPALNR
jgi:2',3'-cyclic-nucleotide 2'-phosphodiesterase (5'-nucleotidase family)